MLLEALFDQRADSFCLVTSDSDFAYLCRKLRERGATVHIVGEAKTPDALRNASDQFFEWVKPEAAPAEPATGETPPAKAPMGKPEPSKGVAAKPEAAKPSPKLRPKWVVEAVTLLAADTPEGKVGVGGLGSYLKRADPSFSPKNHGHSGSLDMLKTYDLLKVQQELGGHWTVQLAAKSMPS